MPPFLLLIYRPLRAWSPLVVFSALFVMLLLWLLLIDLLDRFIRASPQFELAVAALIGLTSFLFIRLFVYPDRALFDLSWILQAAQSVVRFEAGFPPELIIILLNFFIWLRATNASSREIDFWNVGLSFRVGHAAAHCRRGAVAPVQRCQRPGFFVALLHLWPDGGGPDPH